MADGADLRGRLRTEPKATWLAKLLSWEPDMTVSSRTRILNYYKALSSDHEFLRIYRAKMQIGTLAFPGSKS